LNFSKCLVFKFTGIFLIAAFISGIFFSFPKKINALTLQELSSQIAALTDEEEALVEEVITVEANIDITENEITRLTGQISLIETELKDLNEQTSVLQENLEQKRDLLKKRIIYSYKYSHNNVIKMIMTARDINEFASIIYLFKNIMRRDAELLESIRADKESYDRIMRKSQEKKKELEESKTAKQQEQEKLKSNLEKANMLLEKVKLEKTDVARTLAAIKERIAMIQPEGVTLTGEWSMVATAYFAGGGGLNGNGITATGLRARKGIVAVDPRVIRLGTRLYIEGYGVAIAGDTGGWIKGNRVDLCFDTLEECFRYGRRKIYVYLVE